MMITSGDIIERPGRFFSGVQEPVARPIKRGQWTGYTYSGDAFTVESFDEYPLDLLNVQTAKDLVFVLQALINNINAGSSNAS